MKRKPAIHLVDDDPSVLRAISRLLRAHGLPVTTYGSGPEFLKPLADVQPDCVILDVQMPDMGGFELAARLRQLGCKAPVIFITAHEDPQAEQLALNTGAVAFLYKPISGRTLFGAIQAALDRSRVGSPSPSQACPGAA